jgi:predicted dehydrogenase
MIGIGVIGYGYWGPNLVRNFAEQRDADVRVVCDLRAERLGAVGLRYPAVRVTTVPDEVWNDPTVDAVVIATPVQHHFDLAMPARSAAG